MLISTRSYCSRFSKLVLSVACAVIATAASHAQNIHIRELGAPEAVSSVRFGNIFGVRQLTGGRVLINDGVHRQVSILDSTLAKRTVLIDSVPGATQSYGPQPMPFIAHVADTTILVDQGSGTLVLIDPSGKIARIASPPKTRDMAFLARTASATDRAGNLIYRPFYPTPPPPPPSLSGVVAERKVSEMPDTAPIVRANFETRSVDTLAALRISPMYPVNYRTDSAGKRVAYIRMTPISTIDEWSMLSDGTLAIVRGHDYHVDVWSPDGRKTSAPRLPFDFKRLTDEDKQKLVDSARAEERTFRESLNTNAPRSALTGGRSGGGGGGVGMPPNPSRPVYEFLPLSEMPDYYPPIRPGATKADADGNLWILPTTSARSLKGELVYDVVNNRGEMKERVRLPVGRSIAGFGHGGIVYLMSKDEQGWLLERTRIPSK